MDFPTFAAAYAEWWNRIKPNNCSKIQEEEMMRAFYSGGGMMFYMMLEATENSDEEKAMQVFCNFENEITAFRDRMHKLSENKT